MELILKGGVLMIPILLCSIVALAIILERLIRYHRVRKENELFIQKIRGRIYPERLGEAIRICEEDPSPLAAIFHEGLKHLNLGEKRTREAITDAGEREARFLERNIGGLATIAGGAPLLGFLGTVLGMIKAFRQIQELGGNVNASVLAGGIWVALLTTAAGLAVAVPTFFAHNYLVSKVRTLIIDMEERSRDLVFLLITGGQREDKPVNRDKSSVAGDSL
ncbi:MAG: MotA/TolQ/ExbB proton channel family protein [Candidatus Eisenbacteria bacterium]|uniref:MotA/TolQ/ExbB proton channel family protein n=1 Tax=Eiseniibacteriota bacterium TaxID=2212470 RepID=A0A948RT08_UNCEI|nr:MotA/TolQ/ExbB proton channel family protein [Candidatus Eisenbacteria bacterium]MBU1948747.1 MotA/TolQ/ExbB proton channel family protein [Candidatus Eisenbacteria bacterium]MBU2690468.1 MotA/TolQ/ExbB proton channel family protein [Candidatus Eisenbacteria bacterium]